MQIAQREVSSFLSKKYFSHYHHPKNLHSDCAADTCAMLGSECGGGAATRLSERVGHVRLKISHTRGVSNDGTKAWLDEFHVKRSEQPE